MRTIVTMLLVLVPLLARAQEGSVLYEETVKLQIHLPPEMEHMVHRIPKQNTSLKRLIFDGTASLMKGVPREQEDLHVDSESEGVHIRMAGGRSDEEIYTDFERASQIEKREFLGRSFLISGESPTLAWRLTDERSEFLGYLCQKAVAVRDSITVEAWFTPEIPVPAGPGPYGALPGLILVLTEGDGDRTFAAREVSLEPPPDGALRAPSRGRKVSRDEFDSIVEEKLKEMGAERGRGGGVQIIRRH